MAIHSGHVATPGQRSYRLDLRWVVTIATAVVLIGLCAVFGCEDTPPGEPSDGPATAELRLFLEIDYVAGQLRETEYYIDLWQEEVLWGIQLESCGFMYDQSTSRIDLQKTTDDELQWGSSIGREAGIFNYTDEVAILRDVSEILLVPQKTDSENRPNLYLLIADHLIDKTEASRDPDRPSDTYRFDDSALPPAADIMGFVTWPPENEFMGCDGETWAARYQLWWTWVRDASSLSVPRHPQLGERTGSALCHCQRACATCRRSTRPTDHALAEVLLGGLP